MRYRNVASWTGIQFAFDLSELAATTEDELEDAIQSREASVVGDRGRD